MNTELQNGFNDQATTERETRDNIIVRAFRKTATELKQRTGAVSMRWSGTRQTNFMLDPSAETQTGSRVLIRRRGDLDGPHYADLMPFWAKGKYASLNMVDNEKLLKQRSTFQHTNLHP